MACRRQNIARQETNGLSNSRQSGEHVLETRHPLRRTASASGVNYATQPRSRLRLAPSGLRLRTSLPCLRLRLLARRTQGHTKAVVVDAVRRLEPVAVRRTTNPGGADPTAATDHAVRARCGARGVGHGTTRVISMPILTPLPNIAVHVMHVMQPQTFGFLPPTGWLTLPTLAQNQPEVARNQA